MVYSMFTRLLGFVHGASAMQRLILSMFVSWKVQRESQFGDLRSETEEPRTDAENRRQYIANLDAD